MIKSLNHARTVASELLHPRSADLVDGQPIPVARRQVGHAPKKANCPVEALEFVSELSNLVGFRFGIDGEVLGAYLRPFSLSRSRDDKHRDGRKYAHTKPPIGMPERLLRSTRKSIRQGTGAASEEAVRVHVHADANLSAPIDPGQPVADHVL